MDKVIEIATVHQTTEITNIPINNHQHCPFRFCDMELPTCNTGFVYMLIILHDKCYSYIGETQSITTRLTQHNSGNGSMSTSPLSLRPYALFAYVCGFDGNKSDRQQFEWRWKILRDHNRRRGMICMKQIARLASGIIQVNRNSNPELRLVLLFHD